MNFMLGRGGKAVLWAALIGALVFCFFRWLLPCLMPFALAFLTAALCEPAVKLLSERAHLRRGAASALCVLTVLASLLGFFLLVVVRLVDEAVGFVGELPRLASSLPGLIERLENAFSRLSQAAPPSLRGYLDEALKSVGQRAAQFPAALSAWALSKLSSAAAGAPGTVLSLATYAIGSFFISAGFPSIRAFLIRQVPPHARDTARAVKADVLDSVGRWLRAEAALLGITFLELTAAFLLMGVEYAAVIALLTALIDALPVFGTGVVLLPWALASFLTGGTTRAVGLLVTYLLVTVVHECLEPKLIGDRFGVAPAAALFAMYAGFKLFGVAGMVLFPFLLMLLNQMNAKGTIRLWKTADKQEK